MDDREKRTLRKVHMLLVSGISNPIKISLELKKSHIFSEYCVQEVCALPTQLEQTSKLVCMLTTKGPNAFSVFLNILRQEYPELLNRILTIHYQVIMSHDYLGKLV